MKITKEGFVLLTVDSKKAIEIWPTYRHTRFSVHESRKSISYRKQA